MPTTGMVNGVLAGFLEVDLLVRPLRFGALVIASASRGFLALPDVSSAINSFACKNLLFKPIPSVEICRE